MPQGQNISGIEFKMIQMIHKRYLLVWARVRSTEYKGSKLSNFINHKGGRGGYKLSTLAPDTTYYNRNMHQFGVAQ